MLRARALLMLVVAAVLAAAVVGVARPDAPRASPQRSAGAACTADATKALVGAFVRGFARGEVRAIDRMWAPVPRFRWFSTGPPGARLGARARNRATLATYFRARVRAGERLRLTVLGAGYDPAPKIVNFGGKLVRSANDIRPRGPQDFKGAADCRSGRPLLILWSM